MSRIFRISLTLAVFFGLEKLLGSLRQVLIARQFGLSPELDAFNAANNLPDLIFALISGGALAIAFIPLLSEYLETKGQPAAWDLFSRVANLVFLVTAGLSILIAIFARQLVGWRVGISPGFAPTQQALVADLKRLNLVATLLFSLSGLVIAGLQANQHFFLPPLAPAMYDIGTLIGVLILAPESGYQLGSFQIPTLRMGIHGLVYGVILGSILFLGIQIPGLIRYRFHWTPAIDWKDPGVRKVITLLGPRVLTVFFIQMVFLAQDNLASGMAVGAVTALVYGWLIMQLPETLIGTAIGTALLPTLSEQIARRETQAFLDSLNRTVQVILAVSLPAAVLLSLVLRPLVDIFGFDTAGSELVVWTARAFLAGLVGHSLLEVAVRSFYAQQDARTPLLAPGLMFITFVIVALLLSPFLGPAGIALANSMAFSAEAVLLLWLLNRQFQGLFKIGRAFVRVAAGTLLAGFIAYVIINGQILPGLLVLQEGLVSGVLHTAIAFAAGFLVILPFIWSEARMLIRL